MTWEEQEAYIASMKQKWDYKNSIDFAREEEREARNIEIAKKMLARHEPMEKIVEYSELTENEIKALQG